MSGLRSQLAESQRETQDTATKLNAEMYVLCAARLYVRKSKLLSDPFFVCFYVACSSTLQSSLSSLQHTHSQLTSQLTHTSAALHTSQNALNAAHTQHSAELQALRSAHSAQVQAAQRQSAVECERRVSEAVKSERAKAQTELHAVQSQLQSETQSEARKRAECERQLQLKQEQM